ncbi:MAG TPA: NlpC/P60 family protein [Frankiaceae bacterium]|nr:NlpC/P60 family protein [Frankiaceae bacterium]
MTVRTRVVAVLAATALLVVGGAATAHADPDLGTARARAAALRKSVDELELKAAIAVEDYNAATDELATAVAERFQAEAALDRAREASDADSEALATRVRALYMTGGTMTLYASVMEAPTLHDAFGRIANVNAVLRRDGIEADSSSQVLADAKSAAGKLREIAVRQVRLERQVAAAAKRVTTALETQKKLLAAATDEVKRLAEEARIAAELRAQRAFAAAQAAAERAQAAAGGGVTDGRTRVDGAAIGALAGDDTTPPNDTVARAIAAAKTKLGSPYLWGAVGPDRFDCSGLTGWAYRQAGLNLPRTSRQQWFAGSHPGIADLLPGDLLFWGPDRSNPQSIHHVAMYIGAGMMIAAPRAGTVVRIQPVYQGDFFGVTRVAP